MKTKKTNSKIYNDARYEILNERQTETIDDETRELIEERYEFLMKNRPLKDKIADVLSSKGFKIAAVIVGGTATTAAGVALGYTLNERKHNRLESKKRAAEARQALLAMSEPTTNELPMLEQKTPENPLGEMMDAMVAAADDNNVDVEEI